MQNLARITFDHLWMILFADDDVLDPDFSVSRLEELPLVLAQFDASEKSALAAVAQEAKDRLLAEPDQYGYTPRDLVTDEQRHFLEAVIDQDIYSDDWWTT